MTFSSRLLPQEVRAASSHNIKWTGCTACNLIRSWKYNFELFKFVAQCTKCIMEELCTGCQNAPNNSLMFDIVTNAACAISMIDCKIKKRSILLKEKEEKTFSLINLVKYLYYIYRYIFHLFNILVVFLQLEHDIGTANRSVNLLWQEGWFHMACYFTPAGDPSWSGLLLISFA